MNIKHVLKMSERFVGNNSPAILTGIGVAGVIVTAALTTKATFRAAHILENQDPHESFIEKTKRVWLCYIPPALSCGVTIGSIIFANRVGTRRTAALAAAYTISEKAYSEYREKIVEKIGEKKEKAVRDEIVQDRVNANPVGEREVIVIGGGQQLCYETFTGRYFMSTMEDIKKAVNDFNRQLLNEDYASLGDFQQRIGLSKSEISEEVGWTSQHQFDVEISTVMSDDQRPAIAITYTVVPVRNYFRYN